MISPVIATVLTTGVSVKADQSATTKSGQETAIWDKTGTQLTLNLVAGKVYSQDEIDELIENAKQEDSTATGTPAEVTVTLKNGVFAADAASTGGTVTAAGVKSAEGQGRGIS